MGSLSQRWHTASSLRGGRWACGEAGISITQFPAWHWSSCRLGGKVGISCRLVMRTWRSKALSLQVILTVIISPSLSVASFNSIWTERNISLFHWSPLISWNQTRNIHRWTNEATGTESQKQRNQINSQNIMHTSTHFVTFRWASILRCWDTEWGRMCWNKCGDCPSLWEKT